MRNQSQNFDFKGQNTQRVEIWDKGKICSSKVKIVNKVNIMRYDDIYSNLNFAKNKKSPNFVIVKNVVTKSQNC